MYFSVNADMERVDIETYKQACVNNCSCKSALFQYGSNSSDGNCFLPFELFTMMNVDPDVVHRNSSAFIKVQNVRSPPSTSTPISSRSSRSTLGVILTSTIGSVLFLLGVTGFIIYIIRKQRRDAQMEEESIGEVNKSFLAEVQSIGSIHHVNLVRLRGFGAWKSQRFLGYEFMSNGKNFDRSQPEESWHLLAVLQKCWEQGMLLDMVDMYSEDMQTHSLEVVEVMKVASWCLQYDFTKRPSMSTVVKVLEGVMKVESRLDYNFTDPRQQNTAVEHDQDMTPLMASVLSGPR
ncbi:hypothetical protein L1987_79124 [Smallanthus sonchifolius]|uniref:Uncharacterized protein n=1 Tax=Smallanthus sonchifolius TaxID=185202 RepID=A0ACB8ZJ14_9ASTR|nr:hypothetical protein L1987_79124 [Smallanthus sonchifolius]